ncbi:MAG: hypothetical protein ACE5PO_08040 [Candidatus Bathyarchaeia archaeon]
MRTAEDVRREIVRRYDKDPADWNVFFTTDRRGYHNIITVHRGQMWLVKEEAINPYTSVGFGLRTKLDREISANSLSPYPFGLRPVQEEQAKQIIQAFEGGEKADNIITRILDSKPWPSHEIRTPTMLQGPMLQIPRGVEFLSEQHQALDLKLRRQLDQLLQRKYPHIVGQYV